MTKNEGRREALLESLAEHLLEVGLAGASLRPLAAAAGTSDRMLLYYFADKNELLTALLGVVAGRLQERLAGAVKGRKAPEELLPVICKFLRGAEIGPYMKLWWELVALAARGEEPFHRVAGQLSDGFLGWVEGMVEVEEEGERRQVAARLLATVEGMMMLEGIGRAQTAEAAEAALPGGWALGRGEGKVGGAKRKK